MELSENVAVMSMAGPLGCRWVPYGARRTAVHEACHAVVGRALGLHLGECSIVPDSDSLGRVIVSPLPVLDGKSYSKGLKDSRYAVAALLIGSGCSADWRQLLGGIRRVRHRARVLVDAHGDVIREFADFMLDRRETGRHETAIILDGIESGLNDQCITALESGDPVEIINSGHPATVGRVMLAAAELSEHQFLSARQQHRWAALYGTANAEARRRFSHHDNVFAEYGANQTAAVNRLVVQVAGEAMQLEHCSDVSEAAERMAA
jgi:hypothetical protein